MKAVVLGDGLAAAAAAARLVEEGHQVVLVEDAAPGAPDADDGAAAVRAGDRALRTHLARIGVGDPAFGSRLDLTIVDGKGRAHRLRAGERPLPAGLDRLGALAAFPGLSWLERPLAVRVLAAATVPTRLAPAPTAGETVEAWLARLGQPEGARASLWRPLARFLLDDDPARAPATELAAALRDLADGPPEEAATAIVRRGALAMAGAAPFLDGKLRRKAGPVDRLDVEVTRDRMILRAVVTSGGERILADAVIAAVAPPAVARWLPDEARRREHALDELARMEPTPSVTVEVARRASGPAGLRLLAGAAFDQVVVDGDRAWLRAVAPRAGDAELAAEARRLEPGEVVRLLHCSKYGLGPSPRPRVRTTVEGLIVAGAWTKTGMPAGAASAARSAADAVDVALEYEPPPPPPGMIPASRLVRR